MSFKIFKLYPVFYTSPASRFTYFFINKWNYQNKYKKLSVFKKWKAGRNNNGKIIFRSQASKRINTKSIQINYCYRLKKLAFLGTFQFIPFKNKMLSLLFFANGLVSYIVTTEYNKIFSYVMWGAKKKAKWFKIKTTALLIGQIKRLSYISLVEFKPGKGSQYCRSAGCGTRIIKFDHDVRSTLIQLPSKVKKIISYYCIALRGKVALKNSFRCSSNKAGYWRNFGIKPIVRGVAMNPVDHPHGGRTKSVRYPRTPWGKTTKFK